MDSIFFAVQQTDGDGGSSSRNTLKTKLVAFTIMETFICLLNVVFISLIYKYIRKFGIRVVDKYILTSFCILALGLLIRSTINFSNYVIGFGYL